MEQIIIEYNPHSLKAKQFINYALSLDFLRIKTEKSQKVSPIEEGLQDIEAGRVMTIKNPKNLIRECLK